MKKLIILCGVGLATWMNVGCELIIVGVVGGIYLDKERPVSVAVLRESRKTLVSDCRFIREVKSKTYWGGLLFQDAAFRKVVADVATDARDSGGNVVLLEREHKGFMGSYVEGKVYQCDTEKMQEIRRIAGDV